MPEVERVSAIGRREFALHYDLLERPVVIEGGAEDFAACARWSPEYLSSRVGQVVIDYKLSSGHCHPNFRAGTLEQAFARERGTVAELLLKVTQGPTDGRARRLFTGDERFLFQRRDGVDSVDRELGVLLDDANIPPLFAAQRLYTIWGWISGLGVRTWLHYDNNGCHNLNAQITGHKRCTLYPPTSLAQMKPFLLGGDNPAHNCASVDVELDTQTLASVEAWQAELQAGDLLFIPCWWFHTFVHLGEFNTNINFWYRPERPSHSPVAARQALFDAVSRAGVSAAPGSRDAVLLRALDGALVYGTRAS